MPRRIDQRGVNGVAMDMKTISPTISAMLLAREVLQLKRPAILAAAPEQLVRQSHGDEAPKSRGNSRVAQRQWLLAQPFPEPNRVRHRTTSRTAPRGRQ